MVYLILSKKTMLDCFLNGFCINVLVYADDLIIIALTISNLRTLLSCCSEFFDNIDMPINFAKSKCLRIGSRYRVSCFPVVLNGFTLPWVTNPKYLGVTFVAGINFASDFSVARRKFFTYFNTIYGWIGSKDSIPLLLTMLSTICTPTLLFGTEAALEKNKKESKRLSYAYKYRAWSKIFQSYDKDTILLCQYYYGFIPLEYQIDLRRMGFLKSLVQTLNADFASIVFLFFCRCKTI